MNVEIYRIQINKKYGVNFNIPVTYYSQLMLVAYGASTKAVHLDGNMIRATTFEESAAKKARYAGLFWATSVRSVSRCPCRS